MNSNKFWMFAVIVAVVCTSACSGIRPKQDSGLKSMAATSTPTDDRDARILELEAQLALAKAETPAPAPAATPQPQPPAAPFVPPHDVANGNLLTLDTAQGASPAILPGTTCFTAAYLGTWPGPRGPEVRTLRNNRAYALVGSSSSVNGKPILVVSSSLATMESIPTDVCGNLKLQQVDSVGNILVEGLNGAAIWVAPKQIPIGKWGGQVIVAHVYNITIAPLGMGDMRTGQQGFYTVQYMRTADHQNPLKSVVLPGQTAQFEAWEDDTIQSEAFTASTDPRVPSRRKKYCADEKVIRFPFVEVCG